MKRIMTLALVALMIAMTCLPVFAAAEAVTDPSCDACGENQRGYYTSSYENGLDRVIVCPIHDTHDAEVYIYVREYRCNYHDTLLKTESYEVYICIK